tara:strand:- start:491 stop:661 length:171 start_codon:yes stop_codon:yes gene_type:complete
MYVIGCQIFNSNHTNLGIKPKIEKKIISELDIDCKTKIPKLIDINILMASVNKEGL